MNNIDNLHHVWNQGDDPKALHRYEDERRPRRARRRWQR